MTDFAGSRFATGLAVTAAVDVVVFAVTWVVAQRVRRYSVIDVTWGLAVLAITATSFTWSAGAHADTTRRVLVLSMTAAWALRLAWHIGARNRGHGEDPRYAAILGKARGSVPLYALRRVFLPQAVIGFAVSMLDALIARFQGRAFFAVGEAETANIE